MLNEQEMNTQANPMMRGMKMKMRSSAKTENKDKQKIVAIRNKINSLLNHKCTPTLCPSALQNY